MSFSWFSLPQGQPQQPVTAPAAAQRRTPAAAAAHQHQHQQQQQQQQQQPTYEQLWMQVAELDRANNQLGCELKLLQQDLEGERTAQLQLQDEYQHLRDLLDAERAAAQQARDDAARAASMAAAKDAQLAAMRETLFPGPRVGHWLQQHWQEALGSVCSQLAEIVVGGDEHSQGLRGALQPAASPELALLRALHALYDRAEKEGAAMVAARIDGVARALAGVPPAEAAAEGKEAECSGGGGVAAEPAILAELKMSKLVRSSCRRLLEESFADERAFRWHDAAAALLARWLELDVAALVPTPEAAVTVAAAVQADALLWKQLRRCAEMLLKLGAWPAIVDADFRLAGLNLGGRADRDLLTEAPAAQHAPGIATLAWVRGRYEAFTEDSIKAGAAVWVVTPVIAPREAAAVASGTVGAGLGAATRGGTAEWPTVNVGVILRPNTPGTAPGRVPNGSRRRSLAGGEAGVPLVQPASVAAAQAAPLGGSQDSFGRRLLPAAAGMAAPLQPYPLATPRHPSDRQLPPTAADEEMSPQEPQVAEAAAMLPQLPAAAAALTPSHAPLGPPLGPPPGELAAGAVQPAVSGSPLTASSSQLAGAVPAVFTAPSSGALEAAHSGRMAADTVAASAPALDERVAVGTAAQLSYAPTVDPLPPATAALAAASLGAALARSDCQPAHDACGADGESA